MVPGRRGDQFDVYSLYLDFASKLGLPQFRHSSINLSLGKSDWSKLAYRFERQLGHVLNKPNARLAPLPIARGGAMVEAFSIGGLGQLKLFMTLTTWTGGYRASTRGCYNAVLLRRPVASGSCLPDRNYVVGEDDDLTELLAFTMAASDDLRRLDCLAVLHGAGEILRRFALVLNHDLVAVHRRHLEPSHVVSPKTGMAGDHNARAPQG
jgi:hypothetical protein